MTRVRAGEVDATDTIAAIATAAGAGGVGIVRISGPRSLEIAHALIGKNPQARKVHFATIRDADSEVLDRGLALYFAAPNSYTGEDVLELQAHGSPVVLDLILRRAIALGVRMARPGEWKIQGANFRLAHRRQDVRKRNVAVVRRLRIAPADMEAHPIRRNVLQRGVDDRNDIFDKVDKGRQRSVFEGDVPFKR